MVLKKTQGKGEYLFEKLRRISESVKVFKY